VPFRGSLLMLLLASVLYLLSGLGLGLLISTISKTQQEAFMTSFLVFHAGDPALGLHVPGQQHAPVFQWLTC
jgi:ABC-2 type transport system permease protein